MPLVQSKNGISSFICTQFEVRSSTPNDTKLITQINRFCVYEAFKRLGWGEVVGAHAYHGYILKGLDGVETLGAWGVGERKGNGD